MEKVENEKKILKEDFLKLNNENIILHQNYENLTNKSNFITRNSHDLLGANNDLNDQISLLQNEIKILCSEKNVLCSGKNILENQINESKSLNSILEKELRDAKGAVVNTADEVQDLRENVRKTQEKYEKLKMELNASEIENEKYKSDYAKSELGAIEMNAMMAQEKNTIISLREQLVLIENKNNEINFEKHALSVQLLETIEKHKKCEEEFISIQKTNRELREFKKVLESSLGDESKHSMQVEINFQKSEIYLKTTLEEKNILEINLLRLESEQKKLMKNIFFF